MIVAPTITHRCRQAVFNRERGIKYEVRVKPIGQSDNTSSDLVVRNIHAQTLAEVLNSLGVVSISE
jgi:hypothetical protein